MRCHDRRSILGRWAAGLGAIALAVALPFGAARAAPVRGAGQSKASETKTPSLAGARSRALRRARQAALQAALGQIDGPVDAVARKAVLASAEAWTGAYRVLSENARGDEVSIEVEVEIDLVRLTKRVRKRDGAGGAPRFRLGDVGAAEACGDAAALVDSVRAELQSLGAVTVDGSAEAKGRGKAKGDALDVALDCQVLGPVRHTYLQAARVRVVATADGRTVAEHVSGGFATTPSEAVAAGLRQGLGELAEVLGDRRRGRVRLRIRSPLPAARVRRLEAAMRNSVLGVDGVELVAIERGLVELQVRGQLSAAALGRRLDELTVPGLSLSIVEVEPPDVLVIRLD
ncbi:MAG: hypothetical protein AB1Z98_17570 [Nannocystaceae bacterium]